MVGRLRLGRDGVRDVVISGEAWTRMLKDVEAMEFGLLEEA